MNRTVVSVLVVLMGSYAQAFAVDGFVIGTPENLGPTVNRVSANEGGPALSADGLSLFFTRGFRDFHGPNVCPEDNDIYISTRERVNSPWGEPENLGSPRNSSENEQSPSITADGRMLFFAGNSGRPGQNYKLYVASRERVEDPWGAPVALGGIAPDANWTDAPAVSHDGSTLYFAVIPTRTFDQDIWQVPLLPLDSVSIRPGDEPYTETFDEAFGVDGGITGTAFPAGWATTDNGIVFENTTTETFPEGGHVRTGEIYNAGGEQDADRALALGIGRHEDEAVLQLSADVTEADATGLQLALDIEAWDAGRVDTLGEAAFDVTVEVDSGDGFATVADLGRVTTGATLFPPADEYLDGNSDANRVSFDSGRMDANIPADSQLRVRWTAATDAATEDWIFGLDNVSLGLFGGETVPELRAGDADQDLDFDQLDLVQVQTAAIVSTRSIWLLVSQHSGRRSSASPKPRKRARKSWGSCLMNMTRFLAPRS